MAVTRIPSFEEIKDTINTYVTGYYCGRKVEVTLGTDDSSYYIPTEDRAVLSYPCIVRGMDTITDDEVNMWVRVHFYHELSHAMLTPKTLKVDRVINIFEDERIETINFNLFRGVDFWRGRVILNHYDPSAPIKSAESGFYRMVRFHDCPNTRLQNRVFEIIKEYPFFNNWWETQMYSTKVHELWEEYKKWFGETETEPTDPTEPPTEPTDGGDKGDGGDPVEPTETDPTEPTEEEKTTVDGGIPSDPEKERVSEMFDKETLKEIIAHSEMCKENFSLKVTQSVRDMLLKSNKRRKIGGEIQNGYNGIINPRLADRTDMRMWEHKNPTGNGSINTRIKLNLFIDISGSFCCNQDKTNAIIGSLLLLEKENKNFSFDVVVTNCDTRLLPKSNRRIKCGGGNCITDEFPKCYKEVQANNANNINICLFDGDAFSDTARSNRPHELNNLKVLNNRNSIMISDYSNEIRFRSALTNAKRVIFTDDYVNVLEDNIIKALSLLL